MVTTPNVDAALPSSDFFVSFGWPDPATTTESCIAMGSGSNAVAIYKDDPGSGDRWVARYTSNDWSSSSVVAFGISSTYSCQGLRYAGGSTFVAVFGRPATFTFKVFRSTNNGASWAEVLDQALPAEGSANDNAACLATFDASTWIAVQTYTRFGSGNPLVRFHYTDDAGATWSPKVGPSQSVQGIRGCSAHMTSASTWQAVFVIGNSPGRQSISECHTSDTGATIACNTLHTTGGADQLAEGIAFSVSGTNRMILALNKITQNVLTLVSTDGGTTWGPATVIRTGSGSSVRNPNLQAVGNSAFVARWCEGTLGMNDNTVWQAYTEDLGSTWTFTRPFLSVTATGRCGDTNEIHGRADSSIAYRSGDEDIQQVWASDLDILRIGQWSLSVPQTCIGVDATCTTTAPTPAPLADVRVSYDATPNVYTREVQTNTISSDGAVYRYDLQNNLTAETPACALASSDRVPALPAKGLAVTTEGYVVVTCDTDAGRTRFRLLAPNLGFFGDTSPNDGNGALRTEASNRNRVATIHGSTGGVVRDLYTGADLDLGLLTTAVAVDPVSGYTAVVAGEGDTRIYPAVGDISGTASSPVVTTSGITAYALAVTDGALWAAEPNGLSLYTWTPAGFVLSANTASVTVDTLWSDPGMRLTKDAGYLVVWGGTGVQIVDSQTFNVEFSGTLPGTIRGCDVDVFNNHLWCVTNNQITRIPIYASIPNAFGLSKGGNYTSPTNLTFLAAMGDRFDNPATGPPGSGGAQPPEVIPPGPDGGFVDDTPVDLTDPSNFLGIKLAPIAVALDTSLTAVKWLVGVLLIILCASGMGAIGAQMGLRSGAIPLVAFGALIGLVWAVAARYIPIWVLFILIMGLAAMIAAMFSRGISGGE